MTQPSIGLTFRYREKAGPYADALRAAALEPVFLHLEDPPAIGGLDGLLISGGTDIDPALYREAPGPHTQAPDRERDYQECRLLRAAIAADLPVLAICRGLQMLNVVRGGTLIQHLGRPLHQLGDRTKAGDAHTVEVAPETRLAAWIGAGTHTVNSRHHQAVDRLGDGLVESARASDGVIEALEMPVRRSVVGVQWHPEDRLATDAAARALFAGFAQAWSSAPGFGGRPLQDREILRAFHHEDTAK